MSTSSSQEQSSVVTESANTKTNASEENNNVACSDQTAAQIKQTVTTSANNSAAEETESKSTSNGATGDQHTDSSASATAVSETPVEMVDFFVVFQKERFQIKFEVNKTILQLKEHLKTLTNIPNEMQKIMFKGLAKDDQTIKALNIKNGDKLMLIGSTLQDVVQVQKPTVSQSKAEVETVVNKKEPLCKEQQHKRVLEKYGKPDDCMPGILGAKESLPTVPLYGMLNKAGLKVRLTFKLEIDELWLSTKERTEKIPISTIKSIVSEPITDHPQYHIMGIQLGPTESSRYWLYWVPAQYIDSIRATLI